MTLSRRRFTFAIPALTMAGAFGRARPALARARQEVPARYAVASIGVLEGDVGSVAFGINAAGTVIGASIRADGAGNRAVLFRDGELVDLSAGDERPSVAFAINDGGQTTGFVGTATTGSTAVIWDGEEITPLPTLGGDGGQAFGISDRGIAVGGANTAPGQPYLACFWEDGAVTALVSPGGSGLASDINNRGQIAGSAAPDPAVFGAGAPNHAMLWDDGQVTDLGTLGGTTSLGRAINFSGQIAGHSTTTPDGQLGAAGTHAFRWDDGVMTDLGTLPGGQLSLAWDIARDGTVVGLAENPATAADPNLANAAVLWRDGAVVNLNERIPADSGWVLISAYAINDAGQIAGNGYLNGEQRGFLLTPEPA
jgi:probable HAF family extracellular repeat protein